MIGFTIDEKDRCTAGELAGVLNAPIDYISRDIRDKLEAIIPEPEKVKPDDFVQAYLLIKYSAW